MASVSAVAAWSPVSPQHGADVRLTRRGRLLRAGLLLGVVLSAMVLMALRLSSSPIRAEVDVPGGAVASVAVTVEEGDSLWGIAERVAPAVDPREAVQRIKSLNGLQGNLIHPGQELLVPSSLVG